MNKNSKIFFSDLMRLLYKKFHISPQVVRYLSLENPGKFKMSSLETLKFDNLVVKKLPLDPESSNYVRGVQGACFSKVMPTPVENPVLVACSLDAMALLDLPESEFKRKEFVDYFSGNKLLPGSEPAAHCYCGHQFGYFSGQLGDGAAIYLGEIINKAGERWEVQLKGAGKTPYSRTADGRKVLRSSIREFLCSEAMHFLGIPTTRAGSCITSDSKVIRDVNYDNHPILERCTIVSRIAPTFIRFGSFEIFKTLDPVTQRVGPSVGRTEILHTMLQYVIETFFPQIFDMSGDQVNKYAAFFKEVVLSTARLVAHWMSVGFCHGVLNTDNMSILGLSLDYGPFGFLDMYDPNHICNASDEGGRYTYIKQPEICLWNLQKFAEAIQKALPLNISSSLLTLFTEEYETSRLNMFRSKLGLIKFKIEDDLLLIDELLTTMELTGADFTNTFCCFLSIDVTKASDIDNTFEIVEESILKQCYPLEVLLKSCNPGMDSEQLSRIMQLLDTNPALLSSIGKTGLIIQKMKMQMEKFNKFEKMAPEDKLKHDQDLWKTWLEKYKLRVKREIETCDDVVKYNVERINIMKRSNPRFILRNYILQSAIEKAEKGDFSETQKLLECIESPYEHFPLESLSSSSAESVNSQYDPVASSSSGPQKGEENSVSNAYNKCPDWAFSLRVT